MFNNSKLTENRLKQMLLLDKKANIAPALYSAIKSDIYNVFSSYFIIERENLTLEIEMCDENEYIISIKAKADKVLI